MAGPLLELDGLVREFPAGEGVIPVLKDISLRIEAGEMVAIVGASGSGKSTLMNILGCLDRPTRGSYRVAGEETREMDPDALARLRRERFGFIFQRYHLLPALSAVGNVEIPAIYAGHDRGQRRERAAQLLTRLGLGERLSHRPGQLSGGQQQRVSIARALMNGGEVILADEPTGALDTHSGAEVMKILKELHAEGHTVIIVTHEPAVAEQAQRIIEIRDGEIVADRRSGPAATATPAPATGAEARHGSLDRLAEAGKMALRAMAAHRLRTFLTMLGIIIGIASVVSVVALGEGSRQRILADISAIGTNTINIYPGEDFGDRRADSVRTLRPSDAEALAAQSYVDSVTPMLSSSALLRFGNVTANATVNGVGEQYFRVRGMQVAEGRTFDAEGVQRRSQEVVIDQNTRRQLFGERTEALGQVLLLGKVPARVVGVMQASQSPFGNSEQLNVWLPYTTAMSRITGQDHLRSITARIADDASTAAAEQAIGRLLEQRHGRKDFYVLNTDSIRQTVESTTATMTLLISMIALISLVVGGIGVMNIMLVSVTERTKEIGVRMAVGARQGDIRMQFLIEAVLVCLLGGTLGVAAALGVGALFGRAGGNFQMVYSGASIVAAFGCSTLIGVLFGFLPARNAARLDPVEALVRE
ncbi:MacB family efflux pump subunit [Eleftheria terrae]|uniref:MacB family efflux pump subunit n=1 Tax=Eleftheria terrae TaxID=1597781 RepID=UPI00263A62D8|nr:MacB family efflux pump subunit [Eleftheria terrae]WKB54547.1 MacB family efflux pump subunit [Eleftheria terrae]